MTTMDEPEIARERPVLVALTRGETYFWCACGRSKTQPFCDGSHKGTPFRPVRFRHAAEEEVLLCACKRTRSQPYCDGSHNQLKGAHRAVVDGAAPRMVERATGRAELDGGCFVLSPTVPASEVTGGWRIGRLIGSRDGAKHLAQYVLAPGPDSTALGFGGSEVVLFVAEGSGTIAVGNRTFAFAPEAAICIRPGEVFRINEPTRPARIFATVCPPAEPQLEQGSDFDSRFPDRVGAPNASARQATGDRFYQVLIDETKGAEGITQFIGEIPRSRAEPHRHLYEEALVILSGEGFLWTENAKAEVRPGDIAFLPRKQLHALECASREGMRLAGAFYPSGSPAINY
jgi:mannose-6-phosphate isomerase-like protein (cupin superfamily)